MSKASFDEQLAVQKFQEYLRIKTVHPTPDYESAIAFLKKYAQELGLEASCVNLGEGREVLVMTWPGEDPTLPSVVLNSHTDVVPVFEDQWKHDPWGAVREENGDIYGRGTQDMKSVGIQYLEAVRILKVQQKQKLKRTVHLTFMPDEEMGGFKGMKLFVQTPEFKAMNLGFALDEGIANPGNEYSIFYGERGPWWVRVKCEGAPGHGSRFIENTAAQKLRKVINSFLDFRQKQEDLMKDKCMILGDVTSVNLTMLEGGVQPNVVPNEFTATFDIRVPPTVNLEAFEKQIAQWCKDAGSDVTYEFIVKVTDQSVTSTDDSNKWWGVFVDTLEKRGLKVSKEVFSGATDSRYLRELGYQAIGFSPMRNTPILLHDHNEFLNEKVFLEGIYVYRDLIPALANVA